MTITNPFPVSAKYQDPKVDDIANNPEKMRLRAACQEFEAVMTTLIMKEGLKSAKQMGDGSEDDDRGSEMYKDFANEQIAQTIGRQGLMGIADLLYDQVAPRLDMIKKPTAADALPTSTVERNIERQKNNPYNLDMKLQGVSNTISLKELSNGQGGNNE